jgi:hypothetical protein
LKGAVEEKNNIQQGENYGRTILRDFSIKYKTAGQQQYLIRFNHSCQYNLSVNPVYFVHASGYEKYAEYKAECTYKVERIILDEPFIK